jgi:hypothetical protein
LWGYARRAKLPVCLLTTDVDSVDTVCQGRTVAPLKLMLGLQKHNTAARTTQARSYAPNPRFTPWSVTHVG